MATWSEIKNIIASMAPQAANGIVGQTTEMKYYARMTNNAIAGHPYKFSFLFREGTVALTGASSYNLRTLLPDLGTVYLVQSDSTRVPYQRPSDYYSRSLGLTSMTIMNNEIKFNDAPTSGSLVIPYHTQWLVRDGATHAYKLDFENDNDYSVIPDAKINLLIEGIMRFVYRKEHNKPYTMPMVLPDGRITELDPFTYELQNAVISDTPIGIAFTDFRFIN